MVEEKCYVKDQFQLCCKSHQNSVKMFFVLILLEVLHELMNTRDHLKDVFFL